VNSREQVLSAIYNAIDDANEWLPPDRRLTKSPDQLLFGQNAALDSMQLVQFVVSIEQYIADALGANVSLADERAVSQKNSPFRTIATLHAYASALVEEAGA
jgi:hypothetical protein